MLVRCPDCTTTYEIAATLVPDNGVKVRCPKCKAVFPVSKGIPTNGGGASIAGRIAPKAKARVQVERESTPVATAPQAPPTPSKKKILDPNVARRLARAVIQEVLYARGRERQEALADGTPLKVFGGDLADAYDLYAQRIARELPGGTATFRDAINDILGEGQRIL